MRFEHRGRQATDGGDAGIIAALFTRAHKAQTPQSGSAKRQTRRGRKIAKSPQNPGPEARRHDRTLSRLPWGVFTQPGT